MFAKRKTLDGILSTFDKTLKDLEKLSGENMIEVYDNQVVISVLKENNKKLEAEAKRAETVRENIAKLIGK